MVTSRSIALAGDARIGLSLACDIASTGKVDGLPPASATDACSTQRTTTSCSCSTSRPDMLAVALLEAP
jgi:hypothetical protein